MNRWKYIAVIAVTISIICMTNTVDASWWGDAYEFLNGYQGESTMIGTQNVAQIISPITSLWTTVYLVGNTIITGVTVCLGVKYIWGRS